MQNNKNDFDLFSYFIDTTKIPNYAHNEYNRWLQIKWDDKKGHVDIPNSVINIGVEAFRYSGIKSLTIPNSVTSIEAKAFQGNQLESLTIPDSIDYIKSRTFDDNKLKHVTIPSSVSWIGYGAFSNNQLESPFIRKKQK